MKKVLSWVLALALVLSSFSMAFAADTAKQGKDLSDINGNANYDAIVANCDLGIITGYEDGTYKPAQSVTRAEYAALITRMLDIPESALKAYDANQFSDMSGYGWASGYVGFCAAKGIIEGYEDGTFRPGNTITLNEAVTMTLRAVGYISTSSELVGSWPSNYVTLGKRLGLYDDVTAESTVDRASAAQVVYNTLTVEPVAVNKDGDTTAAYVKSKADGTYKNVLEVYHDCTLVNSANANSDGFAIYTYDKAQNSVINTMDYVGAFVKAFQNSDGDVVAIAEVKSTFLTGTYDVDDEEFTVGDKVYTLKKGNVKTGETVGSSNNEIPVKAFKNMAIVKESGGEDAADATVTAEILDEDCTKSNGNIFGKENNDTTGTIKIAANVSGQSIKNVYSVSK